MARAIVRGISVSTGFAIGKAVFVNRRHHSDIPRHAVAEAQAEAEVERLRQAFSGVETELEGARDRIPPELSEHRHILESHLMILKDPKLCGAAVKLVRELRVNAEWALEKAVAEVEKAFGLLDDMYIRERLQDVRVMSDRVMARLLGNVRELLTVDGRVIIMAHDLTPADTVMLEVGKIMGFATAQGGKTSHTGIMARTLGIPALVGAGDLEEAVHDGDLVIIDGVGGRVLVDPDEDELTEFNELASQFEDYQRRIYRGCQLPAETSDGYRVQVLANIELIEEVAAVLDNGGEGIGLYRTEYSYLNRTDLPGEDELADKYSDLAAIMSPRGFMDAPTRYVRRKQLRYALPRSLQNCSRRDTPYPRPPAGRSSSTKPMARASSRSASGGAPAMVR